jgi:tetratricopeptide (TPR) repeat protein
MNARRWSPWLALFILGIFHSGIAMADSADLSTGQAGLPTSQAVDTAQSHYQSGLAYERLGRLDEAYTELQLACALDANNAPMALALGIVATRLNRTDEALRSLEHSIALDANSIASYYELAMIYEKQARNDRALDSWERFLELNQDTELKLVAKKHIDHLENHS